MSRYTDEQTHHIMSSVHSKNTNIEVALRKELWRQGYRYRKNVKTLPGKPDIVFTKYKLAIFCDSEFWHGKDWKVLRPKLREIDRETLTKNAPYEQWVTRFCGSGERTFFLARKNVYRL